MEQLNPLVRRSARISLVALWLCTAATSLIELHGQSEDLMAHTALPVSWHDALTIAGAALDATVGLAIWRWRSPWVYLLAGANLLIMTLAATAFAPELWFDPLGSLTKNLPIAALLWVLHEDARQ